MFTQKHKLSLCNAPLSFQRIFSGELGLERSKDPPHRWATPCSKERVAAEQTTFPFQTHSFSLPKLWKEQAHLGISISEPSFSFEDTYHVVKPGSTCVAHSAPVLTPFPVTFSTSELGVKVLLSGLLCSQGRPMSRAWTAGRTFPPQGNKPHGEKLFAFGPSPRPPHLPPGHVGPVPEAVSHPKRL